jgi:hypothetical protein
VAVEHRSRVTRARMQLSKEAVDSWTRECPGCLASEGSGRHLLRCSGAVKICIRAKVFDKKKTTKTTSIEGGEVRMSPG